MIVVKCLLVMIAIVGFCGGLGLIVAYIYDRSR